MKLSYMMMSLSTITPIMKHPLTMGTIMILQTILLSMNLSLNSQNSWYSYILFITVIGGMMIMFMYMAMLAPNEKFKLNVKIMIIITFMMITMMILENQDSSSEMFNKMLEYKMFMMDQEEIKSTMKFFNLNKNNITMMILMTLFLTMTSVTNIATSFEGPMKKSYV